MAIISILQYPDLRLNTIARRISQEELKSDAVQKIIDDMLETLSVTKRCAALASTQLDIQNPPSITVINADVVSDPSLPKGPLCLVNPEVTVSKGESTSKEGCMSVYPADISVSVTRAAEVKVVALDRYGKTLEIEAKGFFAKCLQHEIDHLNGIICLDRISDLKRQRVEKKLIKLNKKRGG